MKNNIKIILALFTFSILISCKKVDGPITDLKPAVPITVSNAFDFRPEPTVTTTLTSGIIQITLSIPTNSGRTIKEITKIAASTTYTQIQSSATTGFYTPASTPIASAGTSVVFTTTLAAYLLLYPTPAPLANTELGRRFYFLITLDDGSQIVSEAVRVLVL